MSQHAVSNNQTVEVQPQVCLSLVFLTSRFNMLIAGQSALGDELRGMIADRATLATIVSSLIEGVDNASDLPPMLQDDGTRNLYISYVQGLPAKFQKNVVNHVAVALEEGSVHIEWLLSTDGSHAVSALHHTIGASGAETNLGKVTIMTPNTVYDMAG